MSAPNPNPAFISDELWWLWTECEEEIPGVRLSGIYAPKSGYHNTVNHNKKSWPGDYSIRLLLDLTQPDNKARAIDLTLSDEQMRTITGYLKASAEDPRDDRLRGLREFIGTLDGVNVFCMIKDDEDGPWRIDWSRDASHLWHIHLSIFTAFCALMAFMQELFSVLSGQSYDEWLGTGSVGDDEEMKCVYIQCDDKSIWMTNWVNCWEITSTRGEEAILKDRRYHRGLPGSEVPADDVIEGFLCVNNADTGKLERIIQSRESLMSGVFGAYINPKADVGSSVTAHTHSTPAGQTGGVVVK